MADNEPNALILRPAYGLQRPDSNGEKVLSRVVADALVLARSREIKVAPTLIRVGNYYFQKEDYQQILIWAGGIGKSPEELVSLFETVKLYREEAEGDVEIESFTVVDGAIRSVTFPKH